jgi:hypothetical protein
MSDGASIRSWTLDERYSNPAFMAQSALYEHLGWRQ